MKQTVEEVANDYLQKILEASDFEINFEEDNYDAGARDAVLDVTERAYIAGAEWQAKQSPWINVTDWLPTDDSDYIVLLSNGIIGVGIYNNTNNVWIINGVGIVRNVFLYMPIPTFDQIL